MSEVLDWKTMTRDERTEAVKRLRAQSLSASEIAARIDGSNRNVIIGHIYRHIDNDRSPEAVKMRHDRRTNALQSHHKRTNPKSQYSPPAVPMAKTHAKPILGMQVDIMGLTNQTCRHPIWDHDDPNAERLFCGVQTTKKSSYCAYHERRNISARGAIEIGGQ